MKKTFFVIGIISLGLSKTHAEEYQAIFWSLDSEDSNSAHLALQMGEKGNIDFWGLSDVPGQTALDTFVRVMQAANPGVPYAAKLSSSGDRQKLAIIYRTDRFKGVDYTGSASVEEIGDHFFEVESINLEGALRPALGIQLETNAGQRVTVLVNHWKCCSGPANVERRRKQAVQMSSFAIATPDSPIISGGLFNIPINKGGRNKPPFQSLMQMWEYKEPEQHVGTYEDGTILDAVFVANKIEGWASSTRILNRSKNTNASTPKFEDNSNESNHRPILFTVSSNVEQRLQELREMVAELEAVLERRKAEIKALESKLAQPTPTPTPAVIPVPIPLVGKKYFVDGSPTNLSAANTPDNGSAEKPWKTISYAVSQAAPGDQIWVKAGDYGHGFEDLTDPLVVEHSDADGVKVPIDDIRIIGYSGDLADAAFEEIPSDADQYETYRNQLSDSFPVIHGVSKYENTGFSIIQRPNVVVENFYIHDFKNGIIVLNSPDCTLKNLLLADLGDPNQKEQEHDSYYDGYGVRMEASDGTEALGCIVMNAQAEGFRLNGSNMKVTNCKVFSTENWGGRANGTDYAFLIAGNGKRHSRGNIIRDCHAEYLTHNRELRLYAGHSFTLSSIPGHADYDVSGNKIINCTSVAGGPQFDFRGPATFGNELIDCKAKNAGQHAIMFVGGPHNNLIKRFQSEGSIRTITTVYHATGEGQNIRYTAGDIHSNDFSNCAFHIPNDFQGLAASAFGTILEKSGGAKSQPYKFRDNRFFNCTFAADCRANQRPHFADLSKSDTDVEFENNTFVNCIISGFTDYETHDVAKFTANYDFCCFWNPLPGASDDAQAFDPSSLEETEVVSPLIADPQLKDVCWKPEKVIDLHIEDSSPVRFAGLSRENLKSFYDIKEDLIDIDEESGPNDSCFAGGRARYDIGCDQNFRPVNCPE